MNLTVSNVPGPPVPLQLAGGRLLELFPTVSLVGNLTLAVADRATCPDLEGFAEGVRGALAELRGHRPNPSDDWSMPG